MEGTRRAMSPEVCSDQSNSSGFLITHLCSPCCCKLFVGLVPCLFICSSSVLCFLIFKIFIYFHLCWVFVASWTFSSWGEQGLLLQGTGFSLQRLFLLRSIGSGAPGFSSCGSRAIEHRLDSCSARTRVRLTPHGMWNLLESNIEPMSPALAGGFFTTELPGKPSSSGFY